MDGRMVWSLCGNKLRKKKADEAYKATSIGDRVGERKKLIYENCSGIYDKDIYDFRPRVIKRGYQTYVFKVRAEKALPKKASVVIERRSWRHDFLL